MCGVLAGGTSTTSAFTGSMTSPKPSSPGPGVAYSVAGRSTAPTNFTSCSNRSGSTPSTHGIPMLMLRLTARGGSLIGANQLGCPSSRMSQTRPPLPPSRAAAFVCLALPSSGDLNDKTGSSAGVLYRHGKLSKVMPEGGISQACGMPVGRLKARPTGSDGLSSPFGGPPRPMLHLPCSRGWENCYRSA